MESFAASLDRYGLSRGAYKKEVDHFDEIILFRIFASLRMCSVLTAQFTVFELVSLAGAMIKAVGVTILEESGGGSRPP